jgi:tRNA nucleotidyltransferase/poly(A) polymerase/2'-5' RNA ligase
MNILSNAKDGSKVGDNTSVGLFIPLPDALAKQYPSLGDTDKSVPHVTFLVIGDVPETKEVEFLGILQKAFKGTVFSSVTATIGPLDYFDNPDHKVAFTQIQFDKELSELRRRLVLELLDAGFEIIDRSPLLYHPHTTLAYLDSKEDEYKDTLPTGKWDFNSIEVWGLGKVHTVLFGGSLTKVSSKSNAIPLMKFLARVAKKLGVAEHIYVVGGAVRNFVIQKSIKDVDVVIDSVALRGKDSEWFAKQIQHDIPAATSLVTNQYGVAILTIKGDFIFDGQNLNGEVIEIANARKESYGGESGKGYKPHMVEPATIEEDIVRRELNFNTLMWRLLDLANGPDKAEIIDLTGCGLKDLKEGVMNCPRDPDLVFKDDPSRMLRVVKFLIKYGFKPSSDIVSSIKRNAQWIKNIPSSHLSNMLIELVFGGSTGKRALLEMDKLGMLGVIREIARDDKTFRNALGNWAEKHADLVFLFDLMDMGMPVGKSLSFLSDSEKQRVREISVTMNSDESRYFVSVLNQPGKVSDTEAISEEFGLRGKDIQRVTNIARQLILKDPSIIGHPDMLNNRIRGGLSLISKQAKADIDLNAQMRSVWSRLENLRDSVNSAYDWYREIGYTPEELASSLKIPSNVKKSAMYLVRAVNFLIRGIMEQREIPKLDLKRFNLIAKFFGSMSQGPRKNLEDWVEKTESYLKFLDRAVYGWEILSEERHPDSVFKLGPFTVRNVAGMDSKNLEVLTKAILESIRMMKKVGLPGIERIFYGDINIVADIRKSKTLAWYNPKEDDVYIRAKQPKKQDFLVTLMHEFSHRYWDKVAPSPLKMCWAGHHIQLLKGMKGPEVKPYDVGDRLPIRAEGARRGWRPTLVEIRPYTYVYDVLLKDGSKEIREILKSRLAGTLKSKAFPTPYSKTDEEEHFCESVALEAAGKLGKWHSDELHKCLDNPTAKLARQYLISRVAATFTVNEGDSVFYGKYKNKKGIITGFSTNEKGDVLVTIEPQPKGRKQDKVLKLFTVRPDSNKEGVV